MQKHERECLLLAREEAAKLSGDLTISTRSGSRGKMRLILTGPKGERKHTLASSPMCPEDCFSYVRQWVRRVAKEVI